MLPTEFDLGHTIRVISTRAYWLGRLTNSIKHIGGDGAELLGGYICPSLPGFAPMADWHVNESCNDLDLELSESDISFCSDKINIYFQSYSESDSNIENAAATSLHTSFVAKSSANFPAVSEIGDDISRYQPRNYEDERFFDSFLQKT